MSSVLSNPNPRPVHTSVRTFALGVKADQHPAGNQHSCLPGSDPYRRLGDGVATGIHSPIRGTARCDALVNIPVRSTVHPYRTCGKPVSLLDEARLSLETYPCFAVGTQRPGRVRYSAASLVRGASAVPCMNHSTYFAQWPLRPLTLWSLNHSIKPMGTS